MPETANSNHGRHGRRDFLRLAGAATASGVLATGCTTDAGRRSSDRERVKIGLILPETGVYEQLGKAQRNGWNLYLKLNNRRLGDREIEVITGDEGDGDAKTVEGSARKLLDQGVVVACGIISSANLIKIQDMFTDAKVPFLGTNASPTPVQGKAYGWRTSFVNNHAGVALGGYMAEKVGGPVTVMAADYAAGHDYVKGMRATFDKADGVLAGDPIFTPFPMRKSFEPYLRQLEMQDPKAVFSFYAGADAVKFVKEYEKLGFADRYQLYAPGFLTEGTVAAQGAAATGILNSMHYAPNLDNAANRQFVAEYQRAYNASPTCYAMAAYDAGWILDRAIQACGSSVTPDRLEDAIGNVGRVDSPRGPWEFGKNRSPVQKWYLREVRNDGEVLANVVIDTLTTLGDNATG